jgi:hypothetical protein
VTDNPAVSARVLALFDREAGRALRLRYLNTPVYDELLEVERVAETWRLRHAGDGRVTELAVNGAHTAELITAGQAAALLGVKPAAIRRACREHRINGKRPGHEWLIPVGEIARFAAERRRKGGADNG